MEPAIGTRTWYGVRRWGCHYLTRWFRCPPGVEAGLEAGGVSVTPSHLCWYQYTASVLSPDALDHMHWSMGAEWGRCVSRCTTVFAPCFHMSALAPASPLTRRRLQTMSPHAGAGACRGLNMPQMSPGLRSHSCHQAPRQLAGGQSGGY